MRKPVVQQSVGNIRPRLLTERVNDCLDSQDGMTPACLQSLYGIPSTPATNPSNQLAVTGYEYQWPLSSDLYVRVLIPFRVLTLTG